MAIALALGFGSVVSGLDVPRARRRGVSGGRCRLVPHRRIVLTVYYGTGSEKDEGNTMKSFDGLSVCSSAPRSRRACWLPRRARLARPASAIRIRRSRKSAEMGVWFLLAVIVLVEAGFGVFLLVYLRRRARGFRDPIPAPSLRLVKKGSLDGPETALSPPLASAHGARSIACSGGCMC
jgi:hypothetical protein